MKPALIALALLLIFVAEACSSHRHSSRVAPPPPPPSAPPTDSQMPPPPPPPPAATQVKPVEPKPAEPKPADPAPVAEANKIPLEKGMKKVEDADLEGSLELWADGKEIDLQKVIKRTGVYVKVWHEVRWADAQKRERDPANYDRIVAESILHARNLVAAATDGKTDQIKPLAELLIRRCTECHNKYK